MTKNEIKPEPVYIAAKKLEFYGVTYDEGTILTRLSEEDPFRIEQESKGRYLYTDDYFSVGEHNFCLMDCQYKIKES